MAPVRFATYNTLDMFKHGTSEERRRHGLVIEAIRHLNADIIAVQEIHGPDMASAARNLRMLASAVRMECAYDADRLAIGASRTGLYPALLWRRGLKVRPDTIRTCPDQRIMGGLVKLTFDLGGQLVQHASTHLTPFGRPARVVEAEWLVATMIRPTGAPPALVGADENMISADRDTNGDLYDPDPYAAQPWYPDLIHQVDWTSGDNGNPAAWHADRQPGQALYDGGLRDVAPALDVKWRATSGHWPTCPYGPRRVDRIRMTEPLRPALLDVAVMDNDLTRAASDHLPVVLTYDPTKIVR